MADPHTRPGGFHPPQRSLPGSRDWCVRAVAAAIRTSLARGDDPDSIEERIRCAEAAGLPLTF
ncbi:hypothetical protein C5613_42760 [Rhodococcus opacus]|uniref:Uncharacterized protein n=1 Tax=Rhodococcus opacus TaxID=37919 RepID=A0A2S8ICY5_RHOOP|nr:hypothetical protein C5613_42760 [Rhodococcus opacus]